MGDDTLLLYGHLDKQPEMVDWREGPTQWTPVRERDERDVRGGTDVRFPLQDLDDRGPMWRRGLCVRALHGDRQQSPITANFAMKSVHLRRVAEQSSNPISAQQ
ncbi:hypothetical protein [Myxococcus xanthus]|uniref:hypothetical protein n=1 Tax=Myxococcus xanthus TaxID=34 RepID=UPI0015763045